MNNSISKTISKKLTKECNKQLKRMGLDEINFANPEVINQLLVKWNVTIHEDQVENYKQYMQKPFAGREIGNKYVDGTDYSITLIHDCMVLETESLLNAELERALDRRAKRILQGLENYIKWKNNQ
jgi:hypothetical protein